MQIACASCGRSVSIEGPPGTPGSCTCGNKLTVPSQPVKDQFGVARCTNCWKRYGVVGRPAGTRFKCKACGEVITIREPGQEAPPTPETKSRRKGAARTKKRKIDQLADTQDMDALPPSSTGKATAATQAPVRPRPSTAAGRQAAKELTELRASVQKFKAAAEQNAAAARQVRGELEEKEHQLEERTAEAARQAEEIKTLQERNSRQAAEISSLQGDLDRRSEEIGELRTRVAGLEKEMKAREAERDERDAKIRALEEELAGRVTREETEKFRSEKEDLDKRLEEGGVKLSGMKDVIAKLKEPLAEALKRFDEMSTEAGSLEFPDFTEELQKARREAEERAAAAARLEEALGEESMARSELEAERDRLRREVALAREAHEEFVKAAEEEIENLASSAAAAEERKGFLKGLFGGKKQPDTLQRAKDSRRKLKAAAARVSGGNAGPDEGRPAAGALEIEEAEEVEEAIEIEAVPAEEPEPLDFGALDLPEGGPAGEAEEAVETGEVGEAEVIEEPGAADETADLEALPPQPKKKPRRAGKAARKGKRRRG